MSRMGVSLDLLRFVVQLDKFDKGKYDLPILHRSETITILIIIPHFGNEVKAQEIGLIHANRKRITEFQNKRSKTFTNFHS